jgi:hypothetical protein
MENQTEKDNNDYFNIIRSRISLINDYKMPEKKFNKMADKFAQALLDSFGFELISKIKFFAPLRGEYWQFQYSESNESKLKLK